MALDRDRINSVDPAEASNAAMKVVDALQVRFSDEAQMVGLAGAFLLLAKKHGQNPGDLFETVNNVMNGVDGKHPQFRAVEQYLQEEL